MKPTAIVIVIALAIFFGYEKVFPPTIDATNDVTLSASIKEMIASMPENDSVRFKMAMQMVMMRFNRVKRVIMKSDGEVISFSEAFQNAVQGKTGYEIIELAKSDKTFTIREHN